MKNGKVWGTTKELLSNPLVELHWLEIEPYTYCSLHHHRFKWNAFVVISGRLCVEVHKSYGLVDKTWLYPGDILRVGPGEEHRFVSAGVRVTCLELYWPQLVGEDIVRKGHGGRKRAPRS